MLPYAGITTEKENYSCVCEYVLPSPWENLCVKGKL